MTDVTMNLNAKITQLVASKKRPEYVNIYVDGEFALQVSMDAVLKYRLKKDMPWTNELQTQLSDMKRRFKVRSMALTYVNYKMRTEEQVRRRLTQRECSTEEIEDAIAFLREFEYLNDEVFAQMFVRDRLLRLRVSARGLIQELRKRGISSALAEHTVDTLYPHDTSRDLAMAAAEKKMKSLSHRSPEKQKAALQSYLQRQGFAWSIIRDIVPLCLQTSAADIQTSADHQFDENETEPSDE